MALSSKVLKTSRNGELIYHKVNNLKCPLRQVHLISHFDYVYSSKGIHNQEQSLDLKPEDAEHLCLQHSGFGVDCAFSLCIALHLDLPKTRRDVAAKHNYCCILVFSFQNIWCPPEWNFCSMKASILVACEGVSGGDRQDMLG